MDAFDHAMFGSGFRIALGPFKILYRNSKWREACKTTHAFADRYVQKALEYRQNVMSGASQDDTSHFTSRNKPLLYHLALQTSSPLTLRNEILQTLMAAQGTTAALLSNVFFLLARHPTVYAKLRQEILALGDDDEPDFDRLLHLKYLQNILKESMSPHPPSSSIHPSASSIHPSRSTPNQQKPQPSASTPSSPK